MAFIARDLHVIGYGNGFTTYRYDTLDAETTVDGDGYMNNNDDAVNLQVGDEIQVVVWATAVRTGTISDVSRHIVMAIVAGVVDLSDSYLAVTINAGD